MREFKNPHDLSQHFRILGTTANVKTLMLASACAKLTTARAKAIFGNSEILTPLQQSTIDKKSFLGYALPEAPLIATGEMRESIYDIVVQAGSTVIAVSGTDDIKMYWHELGLGSSRNSYNLPPRPVFLIAGVSVLPEVRAFVNRCAESIATGIPNAIELTAFLRAAVAASSF